MSAGTGGLDLQSLLHSQQAAAAASELEISEVTAQLERYSELEKRLVDLSTKYRSERLVTLRLGCDYYAETSAHNALKIVKLRCSRLHQRLTLCEARKQSAEENCHVLSELLQKTAGLSDISEDWTDEAEVDWAKKHKESVRQQKEAERLERQRGRDDASRGFDDAQMWARLDELERLEMLDDEAAAAIISAHAAPSTTQAVTSSTQAVPSSTQAMPSSTQTLPSSTQTLPLSTQAVPLSTQAVPLSTQAVPSSSQAVPSSTQTLPLSTQAVPSSTQAAKSSTGPPRPTKSVTFANPEDNESRLYRPSEPPNAESMRQRTIVFKHTRLSNATTAQSKPLEEVSTYSEPPLYTHPGEIGAATQPTSKQQSVGPPAVRDRVVETAKSPASSSTVEVAPSVASRPMSKFRQQRLGVKQ